MATVAGPSAPGVTGTVGARRTRPRTSGGPASGGVVDQSVAAWLVMCIPTPVTSPVAPGSRRRVSTMAARAWVA